MRCPSPAESCSARRVALYWLPALPPRRSRRPRGLPRRALPRNVSPANYSLGVRCLSRALAASPPPARPFSEPGPACAGPNRSGALRVPPLLGFLLPRTQLRRVPLVWHRSGPRADPADGGCHTPVGAVLRVLAPLDGLGLFARGSHGPLRTRRLFAVAPRRFAALFHAARAPGTSLQSFPFPRSRTRSRGPLASLRFVFRPPPAQHRRDLRDRFPCRADFFADEPRRSGTRDARVGTRVPCDR